jgi:threonine synthase
MKQHPSSMLTHLECPECGNSFDADQLQSSCHACRSPLLARYDLEQLRTRNLREEISRRPHGFWRWAELLPVRQNVFRLTLGEGDTPLIRLHNLAEIDHIPQLYLKDESVNPTGTFKARGMVTAVSRGMELGVRAFAIPTSGNAGGALAAYAGRGRVSAHVFMPKDAPRVTQLEVVLAGADLHLVDGLIDMAGREVASRAVENQWFDVSTFKEPYRVEGKKTMGFELAEAFGWTLPEVIIYPTGGGTGLVGMWKAFAEMEALGWIGPERPRFVSVQAAGCAPVVRAFQQGNQTVEPWENAHTIASGLRVPGVFAGRQILRLLRESQGTALSVSDEEILQAQAELARTEGILASPEGAATLAAMHHLLRQGWIEPGERVVLFNTGSGMKYLSLSDGKHDHGK